MNIINIRNLSYNYGTREVFNNFNLEIKKGSWTSIVGPNGSGKSTLARIIAGLNKAKGTIEIDNIATTDKNIMQQRSKMGFIFDNPDNMIIGETVRDDMAFGLENLGVPKDEINRRINHTARLLHIEDLLDKEPHHLSGGEKQKIAIAAVLVMNVKVLILDDALNMINPFERNEILNILKTLHETTDITIITITCDLEEVLFSDNIIVIDSGVKVIEGATLDVLMQEKIFLDLKMKLPFMVDFSLKLKDYDLLDNIYLDMKDLVNKLWP